MVLQHALGLTDDEARSATKNPKALESVLAEFSPAELRSMVEAFTKFIDFQSQEARQHIRTQEESRQEAQRLQARAEEGSRLKDQFMANISHEIRTPMNGILGMIGLLRDSELNEKQRDFLETIQRSSSAMMDVLDDILDFSRLSAGKMPIKLSPVSPDSLVREAVNAFSAAAYEKGLELGFHVDDNVPRFVETDAMRVTQVLSNLIGNAIKFTQTGGIRIWVGMEPELTGRLMFCVEDDGIGIPQEQLASLFDPFVQSDHQLCREFGGTGLGLSISKSIVKMMGGSIRAESDEGVGSNFIFTIAARSCVPNQGLLLAPRHLDTESSALPFDEFSPSKVSKRVLVVEDNLVNQKVAVLTLQRLGHSVHLVDNGAKAVAAVQAESFDIILMDLEMPVMGGIEATLEIRKIPSPKNPNLRIVAMTGHVFDEMRQRCHESGMDGFIPKPFNLSDLKAALDS